MDVLHVKQLSLPKRIHYQPKIISTHVSPKKTTKIGFQIFFQPTVLILPYRSLYNNLFLFKI